MKPVKSMSGTEVISELAKHFKIPQIVGCYVKCIKKPDTGGPVLLGGIYKVIGQTNDKINFEHISGVYEIANFDVVEGTYHDEKGLLISKVRMRTFSSEPTEFVIDRLKFLGMHNRTNKKAYKETWGVGSKVAVCSFSYHNLKVGLLFTIKSEDSKYIEVDEVAGKYNKTVFMLWTGISAPVPEVPEEPFVSTLSIKGDAITI